MSKSRPSPGVQEEGEPPQPAFQDAIAEVEAITDRIEGGEIGLEDSIEQFERGMKLLARCREILQRVEQRVEDITRRLLEPDARPQDDSPDTDDRDTAT